MITKNTLLKQKGKLLIGLTLSALGATNVVKADDSSVAPLTYVTSKAIEIIQRYNKHGIHLNPQFMA